MGSISQDQDPPGKRGGSVRRLVDEPIVNKLVPTLDDLANTIGARCCDLAGRQTEISSRTNFA